MAAFALVLGVSVVPVVQAAACDCAMTSVAEAVGEADVAFVGRLVGVDGDIQAPDEGKGLTRPAVIGEVVWAWQVERARDADTESVVGVRAWTDDGANCGVAFGVDERWLIVANIEEGHLRTNGCMPNRRMDIDDPEVDAVVASMVEIEPGSGSAGQGDGVVALAGQVLPVVVAIAGLGLVAMFIFRREQST
jgi:hypothetical protein